MKNVLELLENNLISNKNHIAFADDKSKVTYNELYRQSTAVASFLIKYKKRNKAVAILTNKSVGTLVSMFAVVYSGNFYVVLDAASPAERLNKIIQTLGAELIITDDENSEKALTLDFTGKTISLLKALDTAVDEISLKKIRDTMIDTDPLYALFTSGSTGVPKGAVLNHKNVISYTEWFVGEYKIDENTVFGNQTPFYFSMSVSDVYSCIRAGSELHIIPKTLFSFPMKLLEFMNDRKINTIYWVPSALSIIANWKVLDYGTVPTLSKILFAGEVMPVKQLNYWIKHFPNALFSNLFGPTETTDICTYYTVNREFPDDATLPIGNSCNNCDTFILNDNGGKITDEGVEGELYVRGSFLAAGYFCNDEKTKGAFVQNPLNANYPEPVYKTGDIVKYNSYGELEYVSRKDFQIKHMGYRIELGEIEAACYGIETLSAAAVVYDGKDDKIVLIYTGKSKEQDVAQALEKKLPSYMRPNIIVKTKTMPYNQNGKTDRKFLQANYKELIK